MYPKGSGRRRVHWFQERTRKSDHNIRYGLKMRLVPPATGVVCLPALSNRGIKLEQELFAARAYWLRLPPIESAKNLPNKIRHDIPKKGEDPPTNPVFDAGHFCLVHLIGSATDRYRPQPSRDRSRVPGLVALNGEEVSGRIRSGEVVFVTQMQDAQLSPRADPPSECGRCSHAHQYQQATGQQQSDQ